MLDTPAAALDSRRGRRASVKARGGGVGGSPEREQGTGGKREEREQGTSGEREERG
jgi:hypothetical protein